MIMLSISQQKRAPTEPDVGRRVVGSEIYQAADDFAVFASPFFTDMARQWRSLLPPLLVLLVP